MGGPGPGPMKVMSSTGEDALLCLPQCNKGPREQEGSRGEQPRFAKPRTQRVLCTVGSGGGTALSPLLFT